MKAQSEFSVSRFEKAIASTRSKGTAAQYAIAARGFLGWLAEHGCTSVERAKKSALQDYVAELSSQLKPASVRLKLQGVQRYLKWCKGRGLNVPDFAEPDMPRVKIKVRDILSRPALREFMERADRWLESPPLKTAVQLLPCCGLRVDEIATLRLEDVRTAEVELTGGAKRKCLVLRVVGKGGRERTVPVLDEGQFALTEYVRGWRRHRGGDWLFPSDTSKSGHVVTRTLQLAVEKARPPDVHCTPHTFRRTYLTELYRRGVAPPTIARIAGHANLDTLYKHYLNIDETEALKAVHGTGNRLLA